MSVSDVYRRMQEAVDTDGTARATTCPRLSTMAKYICDELGYTVHIRPVTVTKDTRIGGTRLRRPGKREYTGYVLEVVDYGVVLFRHDTTETYRRNVEVARWIIEEGQ